VPRRCAAREATELRLAAPDVLTAVVALTGAGAAAAQRVAVFSAEEAPTGGGGRDAWGASEAPVFRRAPCSTCGVPGARDPSVWHPTRNCACGTLPIKQACGTLSYEHYKRVAEAAQRAAAPVPAKCTIFEGAGTGHRWPLPVTCLAWAMWVWGYVRPGMRLPSRRLSDMATRALAHFAARAERAAAAGGGAGGLAPTGGARAAAAVALEDLLLWLAAYRRGLAAPRLRSSGECGAGVPVA
jgi:hypothetical protein